MAHPRRCRLPRPQRTALPQVQGLHLRPEAPHDARHQARDAQTIRRRARHRPHQERPPHTQLSRRATGRCHQRRPGRCRIQLPPPPQLAEASSAPDCQPDPRPLNAHAYDKARSNKGRPIFWSCPAPHLVIGRSPHPCLSWVSRRLGPHADTHTVETDTDATADADPVNEQGRFLAFGGRRACDELIVVDEVLALNPGVEDLDDGEGVVLPARFIDGERRIGRVSGKVVLAGL